MAGLRRDAADPAVLDAFLEGCAVLDETPSGVTASTARRWVIDQGIPLEMRGIEQELSYYDLLVLWHVVAMSTPTGGPAGLNAAHGGPVFLPWHRHFMILLDAWLQTVLDDPSAGVPYWDWAADGELPTADQAQTPLWGVDGVGEAVGDVTQGAVGRMRVRLWQDPSTRILWSVRPRPIRRAAGVSAAPFDALPTKAAVDAALAEAVYDASPWGRVAGGHRSLLEGWSTSDAALNVDLHNLVHVWVGGDMEPGTSPNDPVFFLNHCNVDRIWEAWMVAQGRQYVPVAPDGPTGHRLADPLQTLFGDVRSPEDVLDPSTWYAYDSLDVAG